MLNLDCREDIPLALDPIPSHALDFLVKVERHYAGLMLCARGDSAQISNAGRNPEQAPSVSEADREMDGSLETLTGTDDQEPSLGGKLLYVGELDASGRALLVAANIAGAASLAVTADIAAQKQAVRDGVADFLVTSLSEALRILKNQVRKRETVAICIGASREAIELEMLERGVLPDLLNSGIWGDGTSSTRCEQHGREVRPVAAEDGQTLLTWRVEAAPAIWLPKLDAIALECLSMDMSPAAWVARRWLRLAPRYLGRLAQGGRILRCEPQSAAQFILRAEVAVAQGEIGVPVGFSFCHNDETFVAQSDQRTAPERAD